METPNLDAVFRYYGAPDDAATWRAAGRELVAYRREVRREIAARFRAENARRRAIRAEHAIPTSAPFLAACIREALERLRRDSVPSANLSRMKTERAALRAYLALPRRDTSHLPCGLQDAESEIRHGHETMARLLTFAIRAAARMGKDS